MHVIMIDTRPASLSRCSKGILELPYDKHEYLRVPDILGGSIYVSDLVSDDLILTPASASVRLEIRRAKGRIRETRIQDPKDASAQIYTTDADFIDEPETKAPWVTFEFHLQDSSADPLDVRSNWSDSPPSPKSATSTSTRTSIDVYEPEISGKGPPRSSAIFAYLILL